MNMVSTDWYSVRVEQESVNRALKVMREVATVAKQAANDVAAFKNKIGALPDPEANVFARDLDRLLKGKMQFGTEAEKHLAQSLHSSLINYLKRKQ